MTLFGNISNRQDALPAQPLAVRAAAQDEALRRMNDNSAAKMRVAIPAIVKSYDRTTQTITAQPTIREKIIDRTTGNIQWIDLPILVDIPVVFPQGGGFAIVFPLDEGDEVLLLFNDMCMDSWFEQGGIQNWNDRRRHDLSDAIAIPGPRSMPNVLEGILPNCMEMRTVDGDTRMGITADGWYFIHGDDVLASGDGDGIVIAFNDSNKVEINNSGVEITGTLVINGDSYTGHRHSGVDTGPGNTGPIVP